MSAVNSSRTLSMEYCLRELDKTIKKMIQNENGFIYNPVNSMWSKPHRKFTDLVDKIDKIGGYNGNE